MRIRLDNACRSRLLLMKTVEDCYQFGDTIGEGGFSIVIQATHKQTSKAVAIKIMNIKSKPNEPQNDTQNRIRTIEQEIEIMKMLKHPNIVEFYDCFHTTDQVFLVMELVSGGELLDVVTERGSLNPYEAGHIIKQVVEAVDYMHSVGIVHRDLYENWRIS